VKRSTPSGLNQRANPARRLRQRYLLSFALLAVFVVAGTLTMRMLVGAMAADAPAINAAGRQRMFSQRLAKDALRVRYATSREALEQCVPQLRETLVAWTQGHERVQRQVSGPLRVFSDPGVRDALARVDPLYHSIHEAGRELLASLDASTTSVWDRASVADAVERILEQEPSYLTEMDRMVALYEEKALARVARLQRAGLLFTLSSLLVLTLAALFVLEPAARVIRRQFLDAHRWVREARAAEARADESNARLSSSEARYRALAENANDLIIEIDRALNLLYVSPSHREVLGMEEATFLGRDTLQFPHPNDRGAVATAFSRLFESRLPVEFLARLRHRDGSWRFIEVRARPYETSEGELHAVAVGRDVTERRRHEEEQARFEEQLRQKQKLEGLGILASGVAHDFNNLLTSVLGNAQLVLMALPDRAPERECLQRVLTAGKRAAELTHQLSTYAGGGKPTFQAVDLCKLVEEMADLLRVSVSKKVALRSALPGNLPTIEGDRTQLSQMLMNLILNASESIGEREGTVRLEAGSLHVDEAFRADAVLGQELREREHVFVRVSDDGPGMDAETQRSIFDPFYTTKFVGRGLGLAVVLGIVRSHRGAIRVQSATGRGTSFTIVFPSASHHTVPQTPALEPRPRSPTGETILVVDDEPEVREVATRMLEWLGFRVRTACDGVDAVEAFRAQADEIDAVLLDLAMPRMSGDEALDEIRRLRPDACVVLMTGYDATQQQGQTREAAPFLRKPFDAQELAEILDRLLSGNR
jgi:PAS domain S-box-containing protein